MELQSLKINTWFELHINHTRTIIHHDFALHYYPFVINMGSNVVISVFVVSLNTN